MLREILEQLFEFAAKDIPSNQILEAKKAYQKETGEIYEDDNSYNSRMALFLEWYLFDEYIVKKHKPLLKLSSKKIQTHGTAKNFKFIKVLLRAFRVYLLQKKLKKKQSKS